MKEGIVVAVCTNDKPGIPKYPKNSVLVAEYGFVDDYHCRQMRKSFRTGALVENTDRHLSLVAQEVIDALNIELGLSLAPGSLGENITTLGLGDLSDIPDGTIIVIGSSLGLRVSSQNNPCSILQPLHRKMVKTIYGRRGILCSVISGVGRVMYPNDKISVTECIHHPQRF